MKKNRTEFFPSNIIRFIPSNNRKLSKKEKKKEIEIKIEKEMKSNTEEFYNRLKRNLQKNEITKEIYLSKNVSKDKKNQENLLISKIDIFEKILSKKKGMIEKISKENSYFLKTYDYLKKSELKNENKSSQREYLNDVVKLYLINNYDLNSGNINNNENIFKYSVLIDKEFGNNINSDAVRVIKEMDNEDFMKEQKLVFDFQDEINKEKMNNKVKHPGKVLIQNPATKFTDYGIDDISLIKKEKINIDNSEENKEEIKEKKENKIINEIQKMKKPRPSFLYLQIKNDIKKMQKNLFNLEKIKSEYKNEKLIKFKESFKPRFSLIKKSFINQDKINNNIYDTEIEEKPEIENPINRYNNTESNNEIQKDIKTKLLFNGNYRNSNKKITFVNNIKRFSILNNLPNINKPKLKNFNRSESSNYSFDISSPKSPQNLSFIRKNKSKNSYTQIFQNNLIQDKNENKSNEKKLINLKKESTKPMNNFLNKKNMKIVMKDIEIKKKIDLIKTRRKSLYDKFLNNSKEVNLHGFTNHLQRITEEKNFWSVYKKNKNLKKYKFSYLMKDYDTYSEDENEGINIKKVDKKIENIAYDSADYLFGNRMVTKSQILG